MDTLITSLQKNRFCIIDNVDTRTFDNIVKYLGHEVLRSDIKVEKNPRALVVSTEPIEWHQDSTEARFMAWHCIHAGAKNEHTEILPLDKLLSDFSQNDEAEFSRIKVKDCQSDGSETLQPLFKYGKLYYCPWLIEETKSTSMPVPRLEKIINKYEDQAIKIDWSVGKVLIIDNHYCLHRRPELGIGSKRHLVRSWISERNHV